MSIDRMSPSRRGASVFNTDGRCLDLGQPNRLFLFRKRHFALSGPEGAPVHIAAFALLMVSRNDCSPPVPAFREGEKRRLPRRRAPILEKAKAGNNHENNGDQYEVW
ncbi:hypothetical protein HUE56_29880 (plasmid) [Azospirillum oryzae]|uniref:Uncharacterized protein n=1 Tax=Azospirillum oryzae TaxID=286727 RepID=A0A6N1B0F7_9PROT|nr:MULTISPECIES: hypothetical protein [Azospirillum]KAA0584713.1 hypothetical protein FZ938_28385 [Azospirillum oryzae]QCG99257.1 hypothetical protein E6C67_36325 [Azospirillum sp. TSA2s]QKS54714.1 hypothetical protein HUE56_29880 [Azospirillum oryzae]